MKTNTIKQQSRILLLAAVMFLGTGAAWGQAEKLLGSWVRVSKAKVAVANFELLSDGTGKSEGSPVNWKLEGDNIVFTKTVKGKETLVAYNPEILENGDLKLYPVTKDGNADISKEALYQKKEKIDEIARIKKEAKSVASFTDTRDKKKYKSVKIDGKTWMAENLNFKTDGSVCYENKNANCTKYGRLYTWNEAKTACPAGWHLPKKEDAEHLVKTSEKVADMAAALKSKTGWPAKLNGTNDLGFSALPGGSRDASGEFSGILGSTDGVAYWWVDLELEKGENAQYISMESQGGGKGSGGDPFGSRWSPETSFSSDASLPKGSGLSVRCVQD